MFHGVVRALVEDEVGALPRREDVLDQVALVDRRPDLLSELEDLVSFPLEMEVEAVEVVRFGEAKPTRPQFEAMTIVPSKSSPDALAILADADLVGLLVGAVFGGDPVLPAEPLGRKPSPIELQLVASLFASVATAFNGSGDRALDLRFPIAAPSSGAELSKIVLRDGPAVKIVFRVSSSAGFGTLSVTMPQRVLLSHRGEAVQAASEVATPGAWKARFGEEVMRSNVKLEATIPLSRMTLAELEDLPVGQVIEFPQDAQANARLSARRKTIFVCEFGKLGSQFTVRVRHPYDAGQEFMDGLISS